jgi:hypothetical protein
MVSRDENVSGFTALDLASGIGLDVRQGDRYAVSIRAEENILPRIRVEKHGSTLRIYVEPGITVRSRGMSATVTLPRLERLELSGGSQAVMDMNLDRGRFGATLSGGAGLRGRLQATEAVLSASGGGRVGLEGQAAELRLEGSGAGRFDLDSYAATNASVELSGGSEARVVASESIEARLSGGSKLFYRGSPSVNAVQMRGGSSIRKL